jgi:hypothetical protein
MVPLCKNAIVLYITSKMAPRKRSNLIGVGEYMRKWLLMVVVLAITLFSQTVLAEVGLTAKAGTLGFGGDLTVGLIKQLNIRLGMNYLNVDIARDNVTSEAKEISVALDMQTVQALLDWHPTGGGFRISAGGMFNDNRLALSAVPNDTVKINDVNFTVSSLDGEATFPQLAPYLGIGYGNAGSADKDTHWRFSFDLGVLFQGAPTLKLTATASNPAIQSILDDALAEETKKQQDDANAFKIYPVLSAGLSYVF